MEAEILSEIRESEKKADEIIERAKREKEVIIQEAIRNSTKLFAAKEEEIRKAQEKKIMDFREKAKLIKEEKIADGKATVKQARAKAEKNIAKAAELVMKMSEIFIMSDHQKISDHSQKPLNASERSELAHNSQVFDKI
mgnify:CR=1 FL=1